MKQVAFLLLASFTFALPIHSQFRIYQDNKVGVNRTLQNSGAALSVGNGNLPQNYAIGLQSDTEANGTDFYIAVRGYVNGMENSWQGRAIGVTGLAGNSTSGYNYGVLGTIIGAQNGAGIFGTLHSSVGLNVRGRYAGYFDGPTYFSDAMTAKSIYTLSDIRLKEKVVSLSDLPKEQHSALENVERMNVIEYNLKPAIRLENADTASSSVPTLPNTISAEKAKRHYGLSAQELQKIYPDLVYEGQDGYLAINYIELVPILIRSIQELKQEINEIRSESAKGGTRLAAPASATSIEQTGKETTCKLFQNTPNPFTDKTVIEFVLPESSSSAYIYIFNMQGNLVKQIPVSAYQNSLTINGYEFTPGLYLYSLVVDGREIDTKKMIITE